MDIKLFYTGAKTYGATQVNPRQSLGGLPSSSLIPNGLLSNLFMNIALLSTTTHEVKAIVLKNISGRVLSNVDVYVDTNIDWIKTTVGAVWLSTTGEMEKITSTYALPYGIVFNETAEDSRLELGNPSTGVILNNQMVGIWIKREINRSALSSDFTPDALYEKYLKREAPFEKEGLIDLKFSYDMN